VKPIVIPMFPSVDTSDCGAVEAAVREVYRMMFPGSDPAVVERAFRCVTGCFRGECPGYHAIDARYHDLEHTLQGTLCMVSILAGRHRAGVTPPLTRRVFELGVLAILLHDSGYAKRIGDTEGTGAKYTFTHVDRSAEFAEELLRPKGLPIADIRAIQHMIHCTGVNVDLEAIPFQDELERLAGYALGTGDLLGQMAAADYVDKLPVLYEEFAEATRFSGAGPAPTAGFSSAETLIRNTPRFWREFVRVKIDRDFAGVHHFLEDPYPGGPNPYVQAIEAHMDRIRRIYGES